MLVPWLGQDFFPSVDSGQFTLHLRAPTGTRIEDTARVCDLVDQYIRGQIPPHEISSIIDNIGLPYSGINLSYSSSAPIGPEDADILVSLSPDHHPTAKYVHDLRAGLATNFPGVTFAFLPSDIVSQILNFGLPAPTSKSWATIRTETKNMRACSCKKYAMCRARRISVSNSPRINRSSISTWIAPKPTRSATPSAMSPTIFWFR